MEEIWDVVNEERQKTGRTMVRGEAFRDGEYHVVVHVCVLNARGEMLIQQRQPFKSGWSNMWDVTAGGSAVAGDTSVEAAEREVLEEIGLKLELRGVRPWMTMHFDYGFDDWYVVEVGDVNLDSLVLQQSEVQAVKWASCEDILAMRARGEFIPYYPHFLQLLFTRSGTYGAIQE